MIYIVVEDAKPQHMNEQSYGTPSANIR